METVKNPHEIWEVEEKGKNGNSFVHQIYLRRFDHKDAMTVYVHPIEQGVVSTYFHQSNFKGLKQKGHLYYKRNKDAQSE